MTEPKPTRFLSQRLLGWAEGKAEEIRAALVAADDAHDSSDDGPECMCRAWGGLLFTYDCTIHGEAEPDA